MHIVCLPGRAFYAGSSRQMDFDVNAYRDTQGRWHHQILGPLPIVTADAAVYEECHNPKAPVRCIGFPDFTAAVNNGWQRVRVILRQTEGKPLKAVPHSGEIRSKS